MKELRIEIPTDNSLPIALGLSGGRDSMALAYSMKKAGVRFFAVNFEHGIRGANSLSDTKFVKDWCEKNGIECLCYSLDVPSYAEERGLTIEQAGRELRYKQFDLLLDENRCSYVALAHHRDDQAETILMRILRGTGVKGLAAMSEKSGQYIRPLIDYTREDIDAYVSENEIPYVEDETNADEKYTRNFIRAELKRIKQKFPAAGDALARLSRNAAETEEYIESQNTHMSVAENGECPLSIEMLSSAPLLVRKLYVSRACEALGVRQDIEERHFPIVFNLIECENGKYAELPHGLSVHKDGDNLVFARNGLSEKPGIDGEIPFLCESLSGILKCREVESLSKTTKGTLYIDADKLPKTAVLRNPAEQDRFEKFGGGTKSLGDYFTDRKIPLRNRSKAVVCASAPRGENGCHEILFVPGVEISAKLRVDENTKKIIEIAEDK